jgi:hypothetical protein
VPCSVILCNIVNIFGARMNRNELITLCISLIMLMIWGLSFSSLIDTLALLGEVGLKIFLLTASCIITWLVGFDCFSSASRSWRTRKIQKELEYERAIRKLKGEDPF